MTRHIILAAGHCKEDRQTVARVIARENRWPLLDIDDLSEKLSRRVLGEATGNPEDTSSLTYRNVVAPAQLDALIATMWTQVDADVDGVVLSAPFARELAHPTWLDDLNYDLALRDYEATVVYTLSADEQIPALAPEHFVFGDSQPVEDLFTLATHLAIELRG